MLSPAALGVFGCLPASQGFWLWCVVQAVLRPGCCCRGLDFTHTGCQEGCPVCYIHFHSPSLKAVGVCLCVSHKWLAPAALLSSASFCCLWKLGLHPACRQGRAPLPEGRHQLCQVCCQSEGPTWPDSCNQSGKSSRAASCGDIASEQG
jgi:hypothetical protein